MRTTLLATALSLGLITGCSNNRPASDARPAESGGTPAPTAQPAPAPKPDAAPTGNVQTAPSGDTAAPAAASVVYYVRDSGIRCIAPPCPAFIATRVDRPDEDGIKVTDLDLAGLNLPQDQIDRLLEASHTAPGIKVEATLATVPNSGPAGAATRLRVTRVVEGK